MTSKSIKSAQRLEFVGGGNPLLCNNTNYSREYWADCLRTFAIIAVITIHVSSYNWDVINVENVDWIVCTLFNGLSRWAVPVFVMISGAFLLDPTQKFKWTANRTRILRIFSAFIKWSILYAILGVFKDYCTGNECGTISDFFCTVIKGHYHLWYCYMIVGLYFALPILRKICEDRKLTKYFLVLSVIFTFGVKNIVFYYGQETLLSVLENFDFHLTEGYVAYFILGFYLRKYELNLRKRKAIYVLGIIGTLFTVVVTLAASWYFDNPIGVWRYLSLNVLTQSIAIFVFCKERIQNHKAISNGRSNNAIIIRIAKNSFGIYLVHVLWLELLCKLGFTPTALPTIFGIPCVVTVVLILSEFSVELIAHIPFIGKRMI